MNKFLGICAVSLIAFGTANTSAMTVSNINTAYQSGHDDVLPYVSPDKKKVVLVVENSGKKSVIADGVPGKTYDSVSVLFSPDSSEFVYFGKQGKKTYLVRKGAETEIGNIAWPVFSKDSKSFAYVMEKKGKYVVVRDGSESKEYDSVDTLGYSDDSKTLSFRAKKGNAWVIVKDGKEFHNDTELVFLAGVDDTNAVAYWSNKNFYLDGVRQENYPNTILSVAIASGKPYVLEYDPGTGSKTQKIYFHGGPRFPLYGNRKPRIKISEGKPFAEFDTPSECLGSCSYDGSKISAILTPNGMMKSYRGQWSFQYLPNEKGSLYVARVWKPEIRGTFSYENVLVHNGKSSKTYSNLNSIANSTDGTSVAFVVSKPLSWSSLLVKDGVEKEIPYSSISSLTYSPDGQDLSYVGKTDDSKSVLVRDGKEIGTFDGIEHFQFLDNGDASFVGTVGRKRYFVRIPAGSSVNAADIVRNDVTKSPELTEKQMDTIRRFSEKINAMPKKKRDSAKSQLESLTKNYPESDVRHEIGKRLLKEIK